MFAGCTLDCVVFYRLFCLVGFGFGLILVVFVVGCFTVCLPLLICLVWFDLFAFVLGLFSSLELVFV